MKSIGSLRLVTSLTLMIEEFPEEIGPLRHLPS